MKLILPLIFFCLSLCQYTGAQIPNSEAKSRGPWGFVDTAGKIVIPKRFIHASAFSEGLAEVDTVGGGFSGNAGHGFIDKKGAFVLPPQFDWAESFSEGLAPVRIKDKWFYI